MNNNTVAQQRAQQFEQQAQQAKLGEQKAKNAIVENAQLFDSNKSVVEGSEKALDNLKNEIAKEVGIRNYDQVDKGMLTARQNGSVGGQMQKIGLNGRIGQEQ